MLAKKISPAVVRGADRKSDCNDPDISPLYTQTQRRAAAKIAAAFGLSLSFALTIAVMAGLGG